MRFDNFEHLLAFLWSEKVFRSDQRDAVRKKSHERCRAQWQLAKGSPVGVHRVSVRIVKERLYGPARAEAGIEVEESRCFHGSIHSVNGS
jgi:hypothetical protein